MANERWQHKVVEIKPRWTGNVATEDVQAELDRLGLHGWQLVNVVKGGTHITGTHTQLYLKRLA